jgi:hypothetical protein
MGSRCCPNSRRLLQIHWERRGPHSCPQWVWETHRSGSCSRSGVLPVPSQRSLDGKREMQHVDRSKGLGWRAEVKNISYTSPFFVTPMGASFASEGCTATIMRMTLPLGVNRIPGRVARGRDEHRSPDGLSRRPGVRRELLARTADQGRCSLSHARPPRDQMREDR